MDFFVVFQVMLKLLGVMLLGYYLFRKDILTQEVSKKISWMVVNVTAPILVLYAVSQVGDAKGSMVFTFLFAGIAFHLLYAVFSVIFAKIFRVPDDTKGVYCFSLIFANIAFMGYPVVESLFGVESVFYTAIFGIGFNLLVYTLGVSLVKKNSGSENEQASGQKGSKTGIRAMINFGTIACVIAIALFLTGTQIPEPILGFLDMVGGLTTPLSMLVIGASMGSISFSEMLREKSLYGFLALRLFVIPLLIFGITQLLFPETLLQQIAVSMSAMPVASMCVMMAQTYGGNTQFASKAVVSSTILSVISLPIVVSVFQLVK